MGDDFEVVGKIVVDSSGAAGLESVNSQLDGMSSKTNLLKSVTSAFGDVARFVWANIVLSAIQQAGQAIVNIGKSILDEANKAQAAQTQLQTVLRSTGGVAGVTSGQVNSLAKQFSQLTTYSDDSIVSMENILLTFTSVGKNVFPQATQSILDMSSALHLDLQQAAIQVGKALQDPQTGMMNLRREGVNFTAEQAKMLEGWVKAGHLEQAQKYILAELTKEFGGSAEAAGTTFAGSLEILKNTLLDTAAEGLEPVLDLLGKFISATVVTPDFQHFLDTLRNLPSILSSISFGLYQSIQQVGGGNVIGSLINNLLKGLGSLNIGQGIGTILSNINWKDISDQFAQGMNKIDWAGIGKGLVANIRAMNIDGHLKDFITQTDWGAVFGAIGTAFMNFSTGLAGGDFDQFKAVWSGDWQAFVQIIQTAWGIAVSWLKGEVGKIGSAISSGIGNARSAVNSLKAAMEAPFIGMGEWFLGAAIGWLNKLAQGLSSSNAGNAIGNLRALVALIGSIIQNAAKFFVIAISLSLPSLGPLENLMGEIGAIVGGRKVSTGGGFTGSSIHAGGGGRASGGDVLAGIGYMVGETGPEPFIPAVSGTVITNSNWLKMVSALSDFTGSMRNSGLVASGSFGTTSSGSVIHNYYGNVSFNLGTSDVNNLVASLRRTG